MLTVPSPALPPGQPVLEKAMEIGLNGLAFPDGAPVMANQAALVGVFVFRGSEVWDEAGKSWRAAPADSELNVMSPIPAPADGAGWKATLVGVGPKDALGNDVYSAGPIYRLRGIARAHRDGQDLVGLSPPSPDFSFASTRTNQRFIVGFDTLTTPPDQAQVVRLQLRDGGLVTAGYLEIRAAGREIELASCDGAGVPRSTVVLRPDGSINLNPGAGQRVVIGGDVEVEHLLYRPLLGPVKKWLL